MLNWENNPANIVSGNAGAILSSGINIYLEVGSDDFLKLNDGTEFLHQVLLHNHIRHEYRLVLGANHVGNTVAPRFTDLLGFLARVLAGPQPDPMLDQILANLGTEG